MSAAIESARRALCSRRSSASGSQRRVRARPPDAAAASAIPARRPQLEDLPFTAKDDLREHYPLGLLAVPARDAAPHPRLQRLARAPDRRRLHRRPTSTSGRR